MNEDKINLIKEGLRKVMQLLIQRGQPISQELKVELLKAIEHAKSRITQLRSQEQTLEVETPVGADLLWILSGSKPDVFINYLRTYPDPALNALATNIPQLEQVIKRLEQQIPQGAPEQADGIPHADLQSSNVYGFQYNPNTGRLLVRFQGGSVYGYDGVPSGIFKIFQAGAVPAKTSGKNKFGMWYRGKIPSLGAAFYKVIRQGGYPYQKLK